MVDDADGWWDFFSSGERTARREHKCTECGRVILKSEVYEHARGRYDGNFSTYKTCRHCMRARSLLTKECGGYLFQGVYEDLHEHIHEILPWSMKAARLCVGMNRKWRRFHGDALMPLPPYYQKERVAP